MALSVTHSTVVAVADDGTSPVGSDEWNAGHTISITGNLSPNSNDGAALGTTSVGWSDLYLATGGTLNWANGEVTLAETSAGLALGGATQSAGVVTPGSGAHMAIGKYGVVDLSVQSAGDTVNQVQVSQSCALAISEQRTTSTANPYVVGAGIATNVKTTTGSSGGIHSGLEVVATLDSQATQAFGALTGGTILTSNFSPQAVTSQAGMSGLATVSGTGNVGILSGLNFEAINDGSGNTVTALYGLKVKAQDTSDSGGKTTTLYGIHLTYGSTSGGEATTSYGIRLEPDTNTATNQTGIYVGSNYGPTLGVGIDITSQGSDTDAYGLRIADNSPTFTGAGGLSLNIESKGLQSRNRFEGSIESKSRTFANKPTAPVSGMICHFSDSTTTTWGATITGGGANKVLGWYNGTNWTVIGV